MPDPYDMLTIAAIVSELRATVLNGRIQRIGLVDPRTIGAEIYARGIRHYLIASADERHPRLRLAPAMPSLDPALVTPFGLLLRKYARGGRILDISQPPLERVVRFSIAKRHSPLKTVDTAAAMPDLDANDAEADEIGDDAAPDDDAAIARVDLYVELMGRHSNLILVDDAGVILDSAKRVTPAMSRVRTVLPRAPYQPPPPPDRFDPRRATPLEVERILANRPSGVDLARALVSGYRGISPTVAREIVFRATGAEEAPADSDPREIAAALAREMRLVLAPIESGDWSPRLYLDEAGEVVAFSPAPMAHLATSYDEAEAESTSTAAAAAEGSSHRSDTVRHAQRRQRLLDAIGSAREKAARRLASLAAEEARAADVETLRARGEMIYTNIWAIAPGQRELVVDGKTIPLDPDLTPSENAQAYFERYRKAQGAGAQIPHLAAESEQEIAYLDQLATLVAQAPGYSELEALAAEWADLTPAPAGSRPRRKPAPRRPKPLADAAGNRVYVGRTGPQNELVTFDIAGPDDTWLHARGVGGSHVVIRWQQPGDPQDDATIAAAAALAAWYSAARESGHVEVDVAPRRHVRKIKGGKPGMVTYRNERTVRVEPAPEKRLRDILRESG
ncbi:MAG: NFACT family protein [Thermomicrobiales bacterium]|nr:NFACT family protein [Thermomicrobiales bacterium]